jgi:hypothetical protein
VAEKYEGTLRAQRIQFLPLKIQYSYQSRWAISAPCVFRFCRQVHVTPYTSRYLLQNFSAEAISSGQWLEIA